MAMSEKHRHAMYEHFLPQLGEEVTEAMMSHYPPRDVEEPVTKEFLKGETTLVRMELREEMATLREQLHGEMTTLRTDLNGDMATLREQLHGEMTTLREQLHGEMTTLRTDLHGEMRQQFFWLMTTILSTLGIMVGFMVTILLTMP